MLFIRFDLRVGCTFLTLCLFSRGAAYHPFSAAPSVVGMRPPSEIGGAGVGLVGIIPSVLRRVTCW